MGQALQLIFNGYSPAGDVAVVATCAVIVILLMTSYVSRTRSFYIFMNVVYLLVGAAFANIAYHGVAALHDSGMFTLLYVLHILYNGMLLNVFFLFALYITEVTSMERRKARIVAIGSMTLFVGIVVVDIILTVSGVGFQLASDGTIVSRANLFMIGYVAFVVLLVLLISRVQKFMYKRVVYGFYGTIAVALIVRFGQLPLGQTSLTTLSFVFPVIAMLYIMHSNPYNVTLGAVDVRALEEMIRTMHERGREFIYMSLLLPDYNEEGKELPEGVKAEIRRFSLGYFKRCVLFQVGNGHVVLIIPKKNNPDFERRIETILTAFFDQYERFKHPYKIVYGESIEEINRKNEYISLIRRVHRVLPENSIHRVGPNDIALFNRYEYILRELADINRKRDLDDPRVIAFCQPVFNITTGQFDTAEALMRLKLNETGLVYPDQFISVAEHHGYIHALTEIILHKTCREIRRLTDEGFKITRISVNVSVLELKDEGFCDDIDRIIGGNGISGDQIAIELTESRSEADFVIMKEKIEELREKGIKFYLDDFGTGYSNMERIMELPFDIIKFDRSLVVASGTGERSEKIVENLANMFRDMKYSVLYEGVEDELDEERCREMAASYLQGYKYSRPLPIEQLRAFLSKAS